MSRTAPIRIAVMGELRHERLSSSAHAVMDRHSFAVEVKQFDPKGTDPGTLMDLLEVLQKAGFNTVELRDPVAQALTPLTNWTASANETGLVDSLCFGNSDVGMPDGHNFSYLAAGQIIKEMRLDIQGKYFMLLGDSVSTASVSAALRRAGAANVRTGTEEVKGNEATPAEHGEQVLDTRHGGGIGFDTLNDKAANPTAREEFRRLFWAERLRQIIMTCQGTELPFSFSVELAASEPIDDND